MTADDAREELESAIWRTDPASPSAVAAVLAAADRYATAVAAERLDAIERSRRIAARRAALIAGDGKHYGRTA
jgi:hypothetical protein